MRRKQTAVIRGTDDSVLYLRRNEKKMISVAVLVVV